MELPNELVAVPKAWREANVTPLFKKGNNTDPSNYRPISLTSVACKIMEKILKTTIMTHLTKFKLLANEQHGFVKNKACITNLLETFDFTTKALSNKKSVDILFLDFAKAFDKVPHKRLLHKLANYGINGPLLSWFESFLTNRRQRVVLGEHQSSWSAVKSGVPQGSVIGPILFILYINDLPGLLENKCKMYADDTKIISEIDHMFAPTDNLRLQRDIDKITEWTNTWLMRLNIEKCKIMHTGKRNPQFKYSMQKYESLTERIQITKTECERDLGVLISNDMKPSCQANKAASKANSILSMLKNTFVYKDAALWKKLYTGFVRPHLEFAVAAWNPYLTKDINSLEKVQQRATKIPHKLKQFDYPTRCTNLGLTTLSTRRLRGDLIQKFKLENGLETIDWHIPPICSMPRGGHRGHFRREIIRFCNPRHNFFNNRIVNEWNKIPDDIIKSKTVNEFKNKLDTYWKNCYRTSSTDDVLRIV